MQTGMLLHDARLFQEVLGELHAQHLAVLVKHQPRVLAKARRVAVHAGLGIAKGLKQRADLWCEEGDGWKGGVWRLEMALDDLMICG